MNKEPFGSLSVLLPNSNKFDNGTRNAKLAVN